MPSGFVDWIQGMNEVFSEMKPALNPNQCRYIHEVPVVYLSFLRMLLSFFAFFFIVFSFSALFSFSECETQISFGSK